MRAVLNPDILSQTGAQNILQTDQRTPTVEIRTAGIQLPPLDILGSVDLSTFPRCKRCFRRRIRCDQRPCKGCLPNNVCEDVDMKDLAESPQYSLNVWEGKSHRRTPKPRASEHLTITPSTFPECDACFRRGYRCSRGNPCRNCHKVKMVCIDVTEASLKAHPDRARHVLDLSSRGPISTIRCRYCTCTGLFCRRESRKPACVNCVRLKRHCTNDLQGLEKKGRSSILS